MKYLGHASCTHKKAFAFDFLQLHTIPLALLYHVHAVTAKPNTN